MIVNAAGGWAGGSASDPEFAEKSKKMWEMNVSSAILAAQLASKFLIKDGLFVLVGAKGVAIHKTPEMLAYAMAKTAVASLAANMSVKSIFSVTILLPYNNFGVFLVLISLFLEKFWILLPTGLPCRRLMFPSGLQSQE